MFDRIAQGLRPDELGHDGRACTTAGARGRWTWRGRARARGRWTWPPGPGTWRWPCGRGARTWWARLLRADARDRAREGARGPLPGRATRSTLRLPGHAVRRGRRWASGRATSPTSTAGSPRWRASTRPGGRVVVLEITTPQKPPLSWFFRALVRPVVPLLGRVAGDPDAYSYLPSSRPALPRAAGAGAPDGRRRPRRRALDPHGRWHHRHPRRAPGRDRAHRRSSARCSPPAGPS